MKPLRLPVCRLAAAALLLAAASFAGEAPLADGAKSKGKIVDDRAPASVSLVDDALTAMKKFRVAPGLKLDVFAAEPLIQDVVNFCFDEQGRVYVVETGRRRTSVFDIRNFRDWVEPDLSFRTVEDRASFYRQHVSQDDKFFMEAIGRSRMGGFGDYNKDGRIDWHDMEVESERIRFVWDSDGDGRADKSALFADDFNTSVSGVAAGVATRKGRVYFTCIPDVWLLRDTNAAPHPALSPSDGERVAEGRVRGIERVKLHSGFGVHIAYGGHDMHGLKFGPDGRVYWSIADRGTSTNHFAQLVKTFPGLTPELLAVSGAVFRSEPDGSNFELVAIGLRNPQELAFDQFGNLFTGDNNADGGDKARWEYIVEGADYGWRYGWQHMPRLGGWNSERLWELAPTNTAAYLLPPVAHIGHGPAGIAFYPGTGMPERFTNHFFYSDFPGGVRHFAVKPLGASFTVNNPENFLQDNSPEKMAGKLLWSLYPTDVDFAPGGGAFVLDWVEGWEKTGKGRLWRVHDPEVDAWPAVLETKRLLAEGMEGRPLKELASLLGHVDQRVRLAAQFALAEASKRKVWRRGPLEIRLSKDEALSILIEVAHKGTNQLARLHAIWGVGQISRQSPPSGLTDLTLLLRDKDAEVRAQCARLVGDGRFASAFDELARLTRDSNPRVRFFAATSLGKLGNKSGVRPVLDLLRTNNDADAYLRHAGMMALLRIGDTNAIIAAAKDGSPAPRMAALLALRRMGSPEVARFLNDADVRIVVEAARAINDVPIEAAFPRLASKLSDGYHLDAPERAPTRDLVTGDSSQMPIQFGFTMGRALNAHFRLGQPTNAATLVALAARSDVWDGPRIEALEMLAAWPQPPGRDRVVGLWRPLEPRDGNVAARALQPALAVLLKEAPNAIRVATAAAIEKLGLAEAGPLLFELVSDTKAGGEARVAALKALAGLKDPRLAEALKLTRADTSEVLRREARRLGGLGGGSEAVAQLVASLEGGSIGEQQAAIQVLGGIGGSEADSALAKQLDRLLAGKLPKEVQLDLLEAVAKRTAPPVKEKLAKFEAARDPKDALAKWREALFGGDAKAGRQVFFERQEAGCFRCHKVKGEGGDVGPELAGVVEKRGREYVMESMALPNKQIAAGFESVLVAMKNGASFAGVLKTETADELVVNSPEDGLLKLKKADITRRDKGLSAMPEGLGALLSKRDVRDLMEFLATAK
jgi:quinoprotein glucose dehydrogenase